MIEVKCFLVGIFRVKRFCLLAIKNYVFCFHSFVSYCHIIAFFIIKTRLLKVVYDKSSFGNMSYQENAVAPYSSKFIECCLQYLQSYNT